MSYILEALRRSETERKQGQIPDLGTSVQMIHKPHQNRASWLLWGLLLALLVNGVLLAWLFWPRPAAAPSTALPSPTEHPAPPSPAESSGSPAEPALAGPVAEPPAPVPVQSQAPLAPSVAGPAQSMEHLTASASPGQDRPLEARIDPELRPGNGAVTDRARERTVANTERFSAPVDSSAEPGPVAQAAVPALGDLPASFQRRVPNLEFNSHIYSARAEARRIMINNAYLREGDQLDSLRIEEITEQGVVFSLQGQPFAMSVVHDWNPPR